MVGWAVYMGRAVANVGRAVAYVGRAVAYVGRAVNKGRAVNRYTGRAVVKAAVTGNAVGGGGKCRIDVVGIAGCYCPGAMSKQACNG